MLKELNLAQKDLLRSNIKWSDIENRNDISR